MKDRLIDSDPYFACNLNHGYEQAIKFAERAIQYADTMMHSRRAIAERARLAFKMGDMGDVDFYSKLMRNPQSPDPAVDIIQVQAAVKSGE